MPTLRGKGADVSAIAALESAYGTAPGSGWFQHLLTSFDPGIQDRIGFESEFGLGHPQDQDPFYEGGRYQPSWGVHIGLYSFGWWLKMLLGAPTTTGAGPYTHVFESNLDVPSFSFEEGDANLSTPKYFLLTGCKLSQMQINLSPKGPAAASFNGIAQNRGEAGTTANGSPAAFATAGVYKYLNKNCKVQRAGADLGHVLGGSLSFGNNVEAIETMRGDGLIDAADEMNRGCGGELRVRHSSSTLLRADDTSETPVALKYVWATPVNAAYKLEIELARAFLSLRGASVEGPGGINYTFGVRAAKPASGNLMKVTLVNNVASY